MKQSYLYSIIFITLLFISCAKPPVEILDTSKEIELECFTVKLPPEKNWTVKNLGSFTNMNCQEFFVFTSSDEDHVLVVFFNAGSPYLWRDKFTSEYFLEKKKKQEINTDAEIEIVNGVKDICIKRKIKTISSVTPSPILSYLSSKDVSIKTLKLKASDKYYETHLSYNVTEGPFKHWLFDEGITYSISFHYISTDEPPEQEFEAKALNFLKNVKYKYD